MFSPGVVSHICNPNTWEEEARKTRSSRSSVAISEAFLVWGFSFVSLNGIFEVFHYHFRSDTSLPYVCEEWVQRGFSTSRFLLSLVHPYKMMSNMGPPTVARPIKWWQNMAPSTLAPGSLWLRFLGPSRCKPLLPLQRTRALVPSTNVWKFTDPRSPSPRWSVATFWDP